MNVECGMWNVWGGPHIQDGHSPCSVVCTVGPFDASQNRSGSVLPL